jgi:transposase
MASPASSRAGSETSPKQTRRCGYNAIVSAPPPPAIVERGTLSDALIIEANADKYLGHTPVERQCARFAQLGVEVAPQTLGRSVAAHLDLLAPVAKLIEETTRGPGLLGTDATGIPILAPHTVDGIRTRSGHGVLRSRDAVDQAKGESKALLLDAELVA